MLKIRLYDPTLKPVWDNFLENCKNATFLFKRDFMDYHKNRFEDFSIMIYNGNKLIALVPGNICLLYTSPSPRDKRQSRMPSSA